MDLIRNIISHFKKNKAKHPPLTINEVTIQQIQNNLQQNYDTEPKKKDFFEPEVPPIKRRKQNVIEVKNGDRPENSNISDAIVPSDDKKTTVPLRNNTYNNIFDLTDNLEVQNDKTTENSTISEPNIPFDKKETTVPINDNGKNTIIDLTDTLEVHNILQIDETADNSNFNISEARVSSDNIQTAVSVNNNNIDFKTYINEDANMSEDIIFSSGQDSAVLINNLTNKTTIIDDTVNLNSDNQQNSQNIPKTDTNENTNICEDITPSASKETVDTDSVNCNKLHNSQNKPKIVTDIPTENTNNEIVLANDNIDETTTKCIREFEDILAKVENELSLDSEIALDEVNNLMTDMIFNSDDEIQISDYESQISSHIVRKDAKENIHSDIIDFSYDLTVETVDSNKHIEFENDSNTERDVTINTTANNCNIIIPDVNININNGNIKGNTNSDKTEKYDTISLSSDDNTSIIEFICISDSSDSDCGYHSSDFEFITEEEAKRDGLTINFRPNYLKNKNNKKAKPDFRLPKTTSNGKNAQERTSKTPKVPTNGKKGRTGLRKPIRKSQNLTRRTNGINIQTRTRNPVQMPLYIQAGPSNPVQMPLYIQAGPSNPVQMPLNIQSGPNNLVQRPSNVEAGTSNSVQMPSNVQAGPTNCIQMHSNIEARTNNPVQILSNVQVGPRFPVQMPSTVQVGPRFPVQMPSTVQAGPGNPVQMPSDIQTQLSNSIQMPSDVQAGPSNSFQMPSNVQPIGNAMNNYESYRNKYKKPFKNDTTYRNNHNEPQEDGYLELFRGFHAGSFPYVRENKSTRSQYAYPSLWYKGVGFDMQMMRGHSSDEEDDESKQEDGKKMEEILNKLTRQ